MNSKSHLRLKYEPLTVKEPYVAEVKTFNNPDEFTIYYREHEDQLKNLSTLRLNKTFKIPGYRITVCKRGTDNQELMLKKDYYSGLGCASSCAAGTDNSQTELLEKISMLERRLDNIERFLQQL
jgi:hypothetical protein